MYQTSAYHIWPSLSSRLKRPLQQNAECLDGDAILSWKIIEA